MFVILSDIVDKSFIKCYLKTDWFFIAIQTFVFLPWVKFLY